MLIGLEVVLISFLLQTAATCDFLSPFLPLQRLIIQTRVSYLSSKSQSVLW